MNYFVTAIGTDSGKTLVSAILCKALNADYWKPVQAGFPRDADTIKSLIPNCTIHPESYLLNTPASPHAAAKIDGIEISLEKILLPNTNNSLIIEGAGGGLVPLNDKGFVIDIAQKFNTPIILVANLYLGSINHTLLTAHLLKQRKLFVAGIIFNGKSNPESERIILKHSGYKTLGHIKEELEINSETIANYAEKIKQKVA
ncbi:MAG: dethiobiotin synthase [Cyclobacteriaceae bacterium]|nr:dethiobiotin synthase [Cyclobacteriaceae bacterium]